MATTTTTNKDEVVKVVDHTEDTENDAKCTTLSLEDWKVKVDGKYNHNNSVMVKNINGTSVPRYKVDKLYQRYLAAGGNPVTACQVKGCCNAPTATAHVLVTDGRRKAGEDGGCWRTTRLCAAHNHHTNDEEMPLRKNPVLLKVTDVRNTAPKARSSESKSSSQDNVKSTTTRTPTKPAPTTEVKGYVRANGTIVESYTRSAPSTLSYSSPSSSYRSPSCSSSSSGSYVSGYTRSNGTVVSGYWRGGK